MARKQQLSEEQIAALSQRVLQLRHDVVSTKQLLDRLRNENEKHVAGNSIPTVDGLLEKSEQFCLWIHQIAEDMQITGLPETVVDGCSSFVKDIQTAEFDVSRLVTSAMEVERELLSASSLSSSQDEGESRDDSDDEFEDAQEFREEPEQEMDGKTIIEAELKHAEESKHETPLDLCQEDERAAKAFQELLRRPGIDSSNWSECPDMQGHDAFQIRGKSYLTDNLKVASEATPFLCVGVQLASLPQRRDNVAQTLTNCPLHNLPTSLQDRTFILLNWQIPGTPVVQVMCYFMLKKEHEKHTPRNSLKPSVELHQEWLNVLHKFWNDGDDFRDARYKLIPRIVDGPWIIRKAVGTKPALLGKKLKQRYFHGSNYLEVDIDLGSSIIAARILSMVRDYCSAITVDMAVTIQGEDEDELPERVMCGVRFSGVNFATAIPSEEFLDNSVEG